jgi:multiple sugar transport system ATP-binding protein
MLEVNNIEKDFGDEVAVDDVSLNIEEDDFMVLVGPSGSGKTTLLRMIAGLETPTSGEVIIDEENMTNRDPSDRNIAMVFQNYALYPHLTVRQNMKLPLKKTGLSSEEITQKIEDSAKRLEISELIDRKPSELSGGQQQRVALGRAIVRDPKVFLMDEPLANLDAQLRRQMRTELAELHNELDGAFVYVTHDQVEAMTMGTKIAVLDNGQVQQVGTPSEVYTNPANEFVAEFIGDPGTNLFPGDINGSAEDMLVESKLIEVPLDSQARQALKSRPEPDKLTLGVRPDAIHVASDGAYQGTVSLVENRGSTAIIYVEGEASELVIETRATGLPTAGSEIRYHIDPEDVHIFADGQRISEAKSTDSEIETKTHV